MGLGSWRTADAATSAELGHANVHVIPEETIPEREIEAIGQLPDGRMIFATQHALLIHDGHFTETVPFPTETRVFQLINRPDGSILIGAQKMIALARPSDSGEWTWEEIIEPTYDRHGDRNVVWTNDFTMRASAEEIFIAGSNSGDPRATIAGVYRSGRWEIWKEKQDEIDEVYLLADSTAFKLAQGRILHRWTDGAWRENRVLSESIEPWGRRVREKESGNLELVDSTGGFISIAPDGTVRSLPLMTDGRVHDVPIAIGDSPGGGLITRDWNRQTVIFHEDLRVAATIDPNTRLVPGELSKVFVDRAGTVWGISRRGVARIDLPIHVTRFDRYNGLGAAAVHVIVRFQDRLYAGTSAGVYELHPSSNNETTAAKFRHIPGPQNQTSALLVHRGNLFAGTDDGVFILKDAQFEIVDQSVLRIAHLAPSIVDPNTIYVAAYNESGELFSDTEGWRYRQSVQSSGLRSIGQTGEVEWWAVGNEGDLRRYTPIPPAPKNPTTNELTFTQSRLIQYMFGHPLAIDLAASKAVNQARDLNRHIVRWGDSTLVVGVNGMWALDEVAERFDPTALNPQKSTGEQRRLQIVSPSSADRAWVALAPSPRDARSGLGWQLLEIEKNNPQPRRVLPAAAAAIGEIHALFSESGKDGEVLWVGGEHGLLRIALDHIPTIKPPPAPIVRTTGALAHLPSGATVPTNHDTVGFRYSVPDYSSGGATAYRSRLTSNEKGAWTPYSIEPTREFNRLNSGAHRFEVQARNADGLTSPISEVHFTVARPWWFSGWGVLIALGLGAGLVSGGMRWTAWRGQARERELEQLVEIRTATLHAREEQLSAAKTQAEAARVLAEDANRAKSTFLAAMSHELRTPLNAILGYSQILRDQDQLTPDTPRQLNTIQQSGEHLLRMINEVLDLAKIEAGRVELRPEPMSLDLLLGHLHEVFSLRASDQKLEFVLRRETPLPSWVLGDESRLRQVLYNLLSNAVKFTREGGVELTVAEQDGRIRFAVTDTGPGIPLAEQSKIFTLFHQASDPARSAQGAGLGLAISQRLVRLMGGEIQLESTDGPGSKFSFAINLPPRTARGKAPTANRIPTGYHGRRQSILIVDDEAVNRDLLATLLKPIGFELVEAEDSETAIDHFTNRPTELILMDLRMPRVSGFDAIRRIRDLPEGRKTRIVAVSASVFPEDQSRALSAGCDEFVGKPINNIELCEVIGRTLQLTWKWPPTSSSFSPIDMGKNNAFVDPQLSRYVLNELEEMAEMGDLIALRKRIAELRGQRPGIDPGLDVPTALANEARLADLRAWVAEALRRISASEA